MPIFASPYQRSTRRSFGLWSSTPHDHGILTVARKMGQGAGAGLLVLSGAGALVTGDPAKSGAVADLTAAASQYDLTTPTGMADALFAGQFNDPLQILGAIFVFLSAGQCIARFFGLAAVLSAFFLHSQGVTLAEVVDFLSFLPQRLEAAATAFAAPGAVK